MWFAQRSVPKLITVTALALTAFVAPSGARASVKDILDLVPRDAWGFLVAGSLDAMDNKADLLKNALKLPFEGKVTDMALAMFDVAEHVDRSSPICAVMMDAQKFGGPDRAAVLLVGAKDPKALLQKLQAEEPTDGIAKCMVMGEAAFAAVRKKVVILGPSQECVSAVAKVEKSVGDGLAKARLDVMNQSDVYLSISLRAVVNAFKDMWMPMLQMMTAPTDPEGKNVKRLVKMMTEVESLDIGVTLDDGGVSFRMLVEPQKESDLEQLFADDKATTQPLLSGLPMENFLFTMGSMAGRSEHAEKFESQSPISDLVKLSGAQGIDADALKSLDKELVKLQKSIKHYCVSISALPEGQDGIFGVTLVAETDDASAFVAGVRKAYATAWKMTEDEEVAAMKEAIVHKEEAERIGDVAVDTITIDAAKLGEMDDQDPKELEHLHAVFGKELVLRFGAGNDKHVIVAFGGGKDRFEKISGALKSSGDALSGDKGIAGMSGQLPSPRTSEFFIAVDQILHVVKRAMKAVGEEEEFPFEVPTINAPIAGSSVVQDKVLRMDFVVPMKLIKAGKEAYDAYAATAAADDFDEEEDDGQSMDAEDDADADSDDGDTDPGESDEE